MIFRAQRCDRQRLVHSKWLKICEICRKRLPCGFWMSRHMDIHRKEFVNIGRLYQCAFCNKRFREIANFLRHCAFHTGHKTRQQKDDNEEQIAPYTSPKQDKDRGIQSARNGSVEDNVHEMAVVSNSKCLSSQYKKEESRVNEKHKRNRKDSYICKFCGKAYLIKLYFDLHMKSHKGLENFKCDICGKIFGDGYRLDVHKRRRHQLGFSCSYCRERFPTKQLLTEHRNSERISMRTCNVCDKVFTTVKSLHVHQRIHNGERPYKCSLCDAAFTQRYHLLDHERTHSGATPFACNYCDLTFTTQSSRRRHEKNIHKVGLPAQMHNCDICEASFARKDLFNQHLKRHEKISSQWLKLLQNNETGADSKNAKIQSNVLAPMKSLQENNRISDEKNGQNQQNGAKAELVDSTIGTNCRGKLASDRKNTQCGKGSTELDVTSFKQKPVCEFCQKGFSCPSSLTKHLKKIHKFGGKGLFCEVCDACFMNKKTLQRHLLQVHNIKTVQEVFASIMCEECGALVQTRNGLELHKAKSHCV